MLPTHLWLIRQCNLRLMHHPILAHACTDEWCTTVVHSAPLSLSRKKSVAVMLKMKLKRTLFRKYFLATGDFFECNTYRVTALGCLKKKKINNSNFLSFQVSHLRTNFRCYHCYCMYISSSKCYVDASICCTAKLSLCKC